MGDYFGRYFQSVDQNNAILKTIKKNPISDEVILSYKECLAIESLFHLDETYQKNYEKNNYGCVIPTDLIMCGTVPLKNLRINIPNYSDSGETLRTEVRIFDEIDQNFSQRIADVSDDTHIMVGTISLSKFQFVALEITKRNGFCFGNMGFDTSLPKEKFATAMKRHFEAVSNPNTMDILSKHIGATLETWYAIQIAMLNPMTRYLFTAPLMSVETEPRQQKKKAKQKVRYVRSHYLTADKLERVLNKHQGTRKYTCLAWYVCGHWRTYKNGRKIFIQPYWKGEMREARAKLDGLCREREIVQLSKEVCS